MKPIEIKIIVTGVFFLLIIISGIWLSRTGRPLNTGVFTIHKLISILVIVLTAISIYQLQKGVELRSLEISMILATGLFFLLAFVSGVLLSFEKTTTTLVLTIHKIMPFLIAISTTCALYIFLNKK